MITTERSHIHVDRSSITDGTTRTRIAQRSTSPSVLVSEYIELCSTGIFTHNCNTYLLLCIGVKLAFYVKGKKPVWRRGRIPPP
jgi:hypothetical protein